MLYSDIVLLAAIVLKPETICRYYPKSKIADEIWGNQGTWVHRSLSQVSMDTSQFYFVFK